MQQYLRLLGRDAWVINFDPANEAAAAASHKSDEEDANGGADNKNEEENDNNPELPYETLYDVCTEAVCLSSVMEKTSLGPNGGLIYCMEYLEAHVEDIAAAIRERLAKSTDQAYLLFDFPGQVELYTHSTCAQNLIQKLAKTFDLRLAAVQLIDAHYCTDATKFLSATLLGTTTMLRLELPTVSVLSKVDLMSQYGELPLQLDYFAECHDLDRLLPFLDNNNQSLSHPDDVEDEGFDLADDPDYQAARRKRRQSQFYKKFEKLHRSIAEVVEDFGLLSFVPLDISSAESVGRVLARIDKCNGYVFTEGSVNEDLFKCAITSDASEYESLADVKEHISASRSMMKS